MVEIKQPLKALPASLIDPSSSFKMVWNIIISILLIYTATVMPFAMAFLTSEPWDFWYTSDLLLDVFFFFDLVVNCLTSYEDIEGKLVRSRCKIFKRYLKSWFFIDLIACFPINLLLSEDSASGGEASGDFNSLLRLLRLPRLYRLLRITRILKMFNHYRSSELIEQFIDYFSIKNTALKTLKTFVTILLVVHLLSCFWYFTARLNGFSPNSWVVAAGIMDESLFIKYLTAFYWAFTSLATVGYGDIFPQNSLERLYAVLVIMCAIFFFSFTLGSLSTRLSKNSTKENILSNKVALMDEFAKEAKLNNEMRRELKRAITYTTETTGFLWENNRNLFYSFPKRLRYKIAQSMHKGALDKLMFFKNRDHSFLSDIVPFLTPVLAGEDTYVYQYGEYATEIWFLIKGKIQDRFGVVDPIIVRNTLPGGYFGDLEVMFPSLRKYGAYAVRKCDLLVMSRKQICLLYTSDAADE